MVVVVVLVVVGVAVVIVELVTIVVVVATVNTGYLVMLRQERILTGCHTYIRPVLSTV